jgi:NAD(P)-dependent dehydrogenase (short-subunit alcohol dehydrogenase family)
MVVTGAAVGSLGYETARVLAAWGANVIVTTRSDPASIVARISDTLRPGSGRVQGQPLDLSERASVDRFADWLDRVHPGLDALVNNAGAHLDLLSRWTEPRMSTDGFEAQWRINYLGTAHLTRRLLPALLRRAGAAGEARVVNVSSHLHERGANADLFGATRPYESWNAYGNSKLALIHMANELQRRYGPDGLRAYSLHPGSVYTNVAARGLEEAPTLVRLREVLAPIEAFFLKSPLEGAQTQVHCATCEGLPGGLYYQECEPINPSPDALDEAVAARLWDETTAWVDA